MKTASWIGAVALLLVLILSSSVQATSIYPPPPPQDYFSANKKFLLAIRPRQIASDHEYMSGTLALLAGAGIDLEYSGGTLLAIDRDGHYQPVWRVRLKNIPKSALISRDGHHVVTFDYVFLRVRTKNAVVIHDEHGNVVRKFDLADLASKTDIAIMTNDEGGGKAWKGKSWIDDIAHQLVIDVVCGTEQPDGRIIGGYKRVKIDLNSGCICSEVAMH